MRYQSKLDRPHIYSAWLMDVKEQSGEISSMFSGYKFVARKQD